MSYLARLDEGLQKLGGIPYLRITRDNSIHDRLLYLTQLVTEFLGAPFRVIDVGCGSGMALRYFSTYGADRISRYVGIDRSTARLTRRYAKCGVPHDFFDVDLDSDWHFGDFDIAWCAEVLEHLIDDRGVFARICRSVRPGGYVVVTMPSRTHLERVGRNLPSLLEVSEEQSGGHVRVGYTEPDLAALAAGTNARLIRVDAATRSDLPYVWRRYKWPGQAQLLNNVWNCATRGVDDSFEVAGNSSVVIANYLSVIGLYQVDRA